MVWFLKSKIKKSARRIQQLDKDLKNEIKNYEYLVKQFQFENGFINIGQPQPQDDIPGPDRMRIEVNQAPKDKKDEVVHLE